MKRFHSRAAPFTFIFQNNKTAYWSTFGIRHTGQPMLACKVSFSTFSTTSSFIFHFFFKISRHKYSTRQSVGISRHFHQGCYNFFLHCVVLSFKDRRAPHDNAKSIGICVDISPILTLHWIQLNTVKGKRRTGHMFKFPMYSSACKLKN